MSQSAWTNNGKSSRNTLLAFRYIERSLALLEAKDYLEFGNPTLKERYAPEEQEVLFGVYDGAFFRGDAQRWLSEILSGTIKEHSIRLPFSWEFPPAFGRSIPYRMNSFRYLAVLLLEYWNTLREEYRNLFIAYVLDWIRVHPTVDLSDEYAWHDDATARRVYFFCVTLALFERILTPEQIHTIRQSLRMQARLLCREDFYKYNHNHGMYQDRALAMYGLTCSEEPDYHLTMAMERSRAYFQSAFTKDGVHKEHSPMYHMDMANSIQWFALAYRDFSPQYAQEMRDLMSRMSDYIVWITMPDGNIPSIGDSPRRPRTLKAWEDDKAFLWTSSLGQRGEPPQETAKVFEEAGYGVIRRDWSMDGSGTYMLLTAATHSMAHKHNDDLNFLLYHKGPLIVEAGNRDYNYANPLTEYVYSSYAHNVLFVNGQGWGMKPNHLPLLEPSAFDTAITEFDLSGSAPWITARQTRFPGVIQDRTLRYDRELSTVEIRDVITLEKASDLRLIYHIAPEVEVEETALGWALSRNGVPVAGMAAGGSSPLRSAFYTRQGEHPWRTWIFQGKPNPEYGTLLALDMEGREGRNVMCLWLKLL